MFGIPKLLFPSPRAVVLSFIGSTVNRFIDFLFPTPNWGVFKKGTTKLAFEVSSVVELDIGGETNVSDYPTEDGTFTSYNKVVMPNMFAIRMTRDGTMAQRTAFLNWLNTNLNNFELYDILCPERTYRNATLKSYRITRNSGSGASMVTADCFFQEIRQIPAAYATTSVPEPVNQPSTPTVRVNPIPDSNVVGFPL